MQGYDEVIMSLTFSKHITSATITPNQIQYKGQ